MYTEKLSRLKQSCLEFVLIQKNKWNQTIDLFLVFSDITYRYLKHLKGLIKNNKGKQLENSIIIKITLGGLFLVAIILMTSCQITSPSSLPSSSEMSIQKNKQPETIYIKRTKQNIKKKFPGSNSGSIWADSKSYTGYLTNPRPSKVGDIITVSIPPELQFQKKGKEEGKEENKDPNPEQDLISSSDYSTPLDEFKMKIIGIEPEGIVYLKGTRNFGNNEGEIQQITVFAKVPKQNLPTYKISAKDIEEISIEENRNGALTNYNVLGWDKVASRKVSGFIPDIDAELMKIDKIKNEAKQQREAVLEQRKALEQEKNAINKDRERIAAKEERLNSAPAPTEENKAAEEKTKEE